MHINKAHNKKINLTGIAMFETERAEQRRTFI